MVLSKLCVFFSFSIETRRKIAVFLCVYECICCTTCFSYIGNKIVYAHLCLISWDTCVTLQWKNNTRAAHFPHNCRFKFVEKNKTLITLRYRTAVLGYRVYSSDPVKSVLQYPVFQSANFRRRIGIFDTRTLL